jgi:hypothetical protein
MLIRNVLNTSVGQMGSKGRKLLRWLPSEVYCDCGVWCFLRLLDLVDLQSFTP